MDLPCKTPTKPATVEQADICQVEAVSVTLKYSLSPCLIGRPSSHSPWKPVLSTCQGHLCEVSSVCSQWRLSVPCVATTAWLLNAGQSIAHSSSPRWDWLLGCSSVLLSALLERFREVAGATQISETQKMCNSTAYVALIGCPTIKQTVCLTISSWEPNSLHPPPPLSSCWGLHVSIGSEVYLLDKTLELDCYARWGPKRSS